MISKLRRIFTWPSLVAFLGLSASAAEPTYIPFAADKAGSLATQIIRVESESRWSISLAFLVPKGADLNTILRIQKIANGISGGTGEDPNPHKGIRLRMRVAKSEGDRKVMILDKEVDEERNHGGGINKFLLNIGDVRLPPGEYAVSVEALDDDPRFANVNVALTVDTWWQ